MKVEITKKNIVNKEEYQTIISLIDALDKLEDETHDDEMTDYIYDARFALSDLVDFLEYEN